MLRFSKTKLIYKYVKVGILYLTTNVSYLLCVLIRARSQYFKHISLNVQYMLPGSLQSHYLSHSFEEMK